MSLVIRGAEIVTASDRYVADVRVTGETIAAIGGELPAESGDEIVDGSDQWLIPGGIDPHVHMALPFMGTVSIDDFESGSIAAIMGGTTGMIDFVIPSKGESLLATLETWHAKAEGKAALDYTFHMAVTDWDERIAREIPLVVRDHGITSFKIFMAYKGVLGVDDEQIFHILEATRDAGGFVNVHAVNGDVQLLLADRFAESGKTGTRYHALAQPPRAEGEATGRVIDLGAVAGQQVYVVHVTCDDAIERIAAARARGEPVWGETCTQYLLLDDSRYDLPDFEGAKYVLSPPLRKTADQEALWTALATDAISVVGTDHCAFDFATQKAMGRDDFRKIPNGFMGLEERLPLLHTHGVATGRISANRWVELCATNPAKIFGLYPRKGTIAVGSDADLVLWDPGASGRISAKTHHSRCDYNVYEGFETLGAPTRVWVRGELAASDGEFIGTVGRGRFVKRAPGSGLRPGAGVSASA
ncbi:MAG TPA: dihydropyrimidinase [Gemmatimonadota bacterium]|nr:dihydropyrimidinase [Gemmatimonadota bacterium]